MSHVNTAELLEEIPDDESRHLEVLEEDSMTVEVGRYPAGETAGKNPHTEDEIYYIVSGSGTARIGDETHSIEAGDVVFVEQGTEHDFFDIEEDITVLIIFAESANPASYSIREDTELEPSAEQ
jgi:mannose-6-phosphate isomerase-like protein (cupin superfamily)